jgi:hypothetical protein
MRAWLRVLRSVLIKHVLHTIESVLLIRVLFLQLKSCICSFLVRRMRTNHVQLRLHRPRMFGRTLVNGERERRLPG